MNKQLWLSCAALAGTLALGACVTQDDYNKKMVEIDGRFTALNTKVDGVDQTAQSGVQKAGQAQQTADQALQKANQALQQTAALQTSKADARFTYTDQHSGVSVQFDTAKWTLSPEAQAALTDFAAKLKSDNKDVYLQIIGRADSRGSVAANRALGGLRALQVQRFLSDQGVALNRMDVVSWGEEKNTGGKDKAALAADRRVDIIVYG